MNSNEFNYNPKAICKCCTEEIFANGNVLVRCVDCEVLDLCPECFSSNPDLGLEHKSDHSYRLIDNAGYPVLGTSWSARDHVRLLDAIEQYGYGNWEDIARYVSSHGNSSLSSSSLSSYKSPAEVKEEYCSTFITGIVGRLTWKEDTRGQAHDHTQPNSPSSTGQNEPPPSLTLHESIMLGYMPKRDDFEVEYDNPAESLVSQLQGGMTAPPDEDEVDVALKIAHVDMYKFKLRERERRKRVSREHGLINRFFKENPINGETKKNGNSQIKGRPNNVLANNNNNGNNNKNIDALDRLKILAGIQDVKEHQDFILSMNRERELKARIKDLTKYRKNGITKSADSVEFEHQKNSRQNRKRNEIRRRNGESLDSTSSPIIKTEDLNGISIHPAVSPARDALENKLTAIAGLPCYDILSCNEKKLCVNLKLTPAQYISYKTSLLTNHLQKKKGQTPKPLNPIGLDKNNRKIIFNFLMRAGWINAY